MNPYLVHVLRTDLTNWDLVVPDERARNVPMRFQNAWNIKLVSHLDNGKPVDMETWYCQDEVSAMCLCKALAQEAPGRRVCMYELKGMASSVAAPATFATYGEKGLIPA